MCKGYTKEGRRCIKGMDNKYCDNHNPEFVYKHCALTAEYLINNTWVIRENEVTHELELDKIVYRNPELHYQVFKGILPYLRDCYKYGICISNRVTQNFLRLHSRMTGHREVLPEIQIVWTVEQRAAHDIEEIRS